MIFRATSAAVAAFLFVCILSASASFAQSVLTVKHALSILSEVRPALAQAALSTPAAEKGQAPEERAPREEHNREGNGKGAPDVRGLP